jgi:hypothetical protein
MRRHRRRYQFYLAWLAIRGADGIVLIAAGYGLTALAVHLWAPS